MNTLEVAMRAVETPEWVKNMPAFQAQPQCLKCTCSILLPKFHVDINKDGWGEYLLWSCNDCGAMRYTRCKDHTPPTAES